MTEDTVKINTESIGKAGNFLKKYFLKNKFVFIFSLMALLALFFGIFSLLGISLKVSFLMQITNLFSPFLWILLGISLIISGILAYFEKYKLMILPIMIWLLITTAVIRTSNISGLKNEATGDWVLGPDLDPFLYLRNAFEILSGTNTGKIDMMRYAPLGAASYLHINMMPWMIVYIYKLMSMFSSNISVTYAAIIAPVIFFIASLIGFFFFLYVLFSFKFSKEKSLIIATIASFFYAFVPSMLHRTIAGIPELESLGMVWFWLAFLFFALAWKKTSNKSRIIYGLLAGIFTGAMSWVWGGYRYIYMTLALASFLCFFLNIEKRKNLIIFGSFLFSGILIELLKTKNIISIATDLTDTGLALSVLFIMLIHFILFKTKIKEIFTEKINRKIKLPENILSIIIFLILGLIIMFLVDPTFIKDIFSRIIEGLLYPFGRGRVGLTVAENRAPYFVEVLSEFGNLIWLFLIGLIIMFYEAVKHFSSKKRFWLNFFFILFILSFIFSRVSSSSLLNGENFISKTLYFGGLSVFGLVFLIMYIQAYSKKDEKTLDDFSKINFASLILLSLSFWAVISMRGAIRLFFIIAPVIIIISSYSLIKIFDYRKTKDDVLKMFFWIILIIGIFIAVSTGISYASTTTQSSPNIVPDIYNQQWNYAMKWVSENTPEGSIFVHWWDYGYWVQTLGKRPTVTDGGHFINWWDYTTARYLLTTSKPETALSLMKTYNVSYLLIDSTDVGKYSAYSSIGSDATGEDRLSWIPTMMVDSSQTKETANKTTLVYSGGTGTDKDIIYTAKNSSEQIFLPAQKSALGGVILEYSTKNNEAFFSQPIGIFFYNNKQYNLPIRYIYYNNKVMDFGSGINSEIMLIPLVSQSSTEGIKIERFGVIIYLSEKTKDTLFAELYLKDDVNNKYSTIKIAHVEDDYIVKSLKAQGLDLGSIIYFQGFRGPIKIWEINYPENIITQDEFLYKPEGWNTMTGPWATMDNLQFMK